jgi:hypothetical protein
MGDADCLSPGERKKLKTEEKTPEEEFCCEKEDLRSGFLRPPTTGLDENWSEVVPEGRVLETSSRFREVVLLGGAAK